MALEKNESKYKYTGPFSLKEIEERLLEIDAEKSARTFSTHEYLDVKKTQLQLKRQFILDERNGWKAKSLWNIAVPIVVSVITATIVFLFLNK